MELSAYIAPLRRWWWLLVAATLVAGISSLVATYRQPPIYQAKTTLMIGRFIDDPNPSQGEFSLAQQLATTYAEMGNREPVREATKNALGLNWLPQYLARAVPNSQLIEILVTDVDPLRAQVVANELANQLILRSPTGARPEDRERQEFINTQLNDLQAQIINTQDEIARLEEQLGNLNSARQLADTQTQISALQTKLNTLQGNYAALLANTQQGATNTLAVVEPADLPTRPIGPNKSLSIMLSAAVGLGLAAGAAYLLEYLDDTLKSPDEVSRLLGIPVLGYISEMDGTDEDENKVYVAKHPRSPIAEAYRSLRANLEFAGVDSPLKTIMVTSAGQAAGKSSVAANLAIVISQGEKRVTLVDADLRRPSIHKYTNLSNNIGLSDVFRDGVDISLALKIWNNENMRVVTGGSTPPNPAELLGSKRMDQILAKLSDKSDMVIVDSPPFIVSDALTLATKVDGILLVIRPGETKKKIALAMMEQLNRAGARVLGVVMNRIPRNNLDSYGGFLYYSPYYTNGYYHGKDGVAENMKSQEKSGDWKLKVNKYIRLMKPFWAKSQENIKTVIKGRREYDYYPSVYLEDDDQKDEGVNIFRN